MVGLLLIHVYHWLVHLWINSTSQLTFLG